MCFKTSVAKEIGILMHDDQLRTCLSMWSCRLCEVLSTV